MTECKGRRLVVITDGALPMNVMWYDAETGKVAGQRKVQFAQDESGNLPTTSEQSVAVDGEGGTDQRGEGGREEGREGRWVVRTDGMARPPSPPDPFSTPHTNHPTISPLYPPPLTGCKAFVVQNYMGEESLDDSVFCTTAPPSLFQGGVVRDQVSQPLRSSVT